MQDGSLYLGKANLMQKICKRGLQSSKNLWANISMNLSFRQICSRLVKILEGMLGTSMLPLPVTVLCNLCNAGKEKYLAVNW